MLQHAERVGQDGVYLEIHDWFLYSIKKSIDLTILTNGAPDLHITTTAEIQDRLGSGCSGIERIQKAKQQWSILLTTADFSPQSNVGLCNHWAVCTPTADLPANALEEEFSRLDRNLDRMKRDHLKHVYSTESDHAGAHYNALWDWHAQEKAKLNRLKEMMTKLHKDQHVMVRDVPADGNCGLWSILSLEGHQKFSHAAMRQKRAELQSMWRKVAGDPAWQECFKDLGGWDKIRSAPPPVDPAARKAEGAEQAEIDRVKAFSDDYSPPKLSQTARRSGKAGLLNPLPTSGPAHPLRSLPASLEDAAKGRAKPKVTEKPAKRACSQKPETAGAADAKQIKQVEKPELLNGFKIEVKEEESDSEDMFIVSATASNTMPKRSKAGKKTKKDKPAKPPKDPHVRLSDLKKKAARNYLAHIGIIHKDYVRIHSKGELLKGSVDCNEGKWATMVEELIAGKMPTQCVKCQRLLANKGKTPFSMDALQEVLSQVGTNSSAGSQLNAGDAGAADLAQTVPATEPDADPGRVPDDQDDQAEPQDEQLPEPLTAEGLQKQYPFLEFLEEGTHKKRIPVRCKLCFRASSKKHTVFEAPVWTYWYFFDFICWAEVCFELSELCEFRFVFTGALMCCRGPCWDKTQQP